ncbi:FAD-binding protein [Streptosporangium algeriense]|uniref:FAD-binding protein n=1 Tax=Streptosporangium algeriense TaxID=1682748 RepID=A0ABW3DRI3_9ACTN
MVGTGHSFTGVALTDGLLLRPERLTGVLQTGEGWVKAAAGTPLNVFNEELARRGLALANMGDITAQTLAGAVQTGTHGTGGRVGGGHHGGLGVEGGQPPQGTPEQGEEPDEAGADDDGGPRPDVPHQQQDHAEDGVEREDVAEPQEESVEHAQHQQGQAAPEHPGLHLVLAPGAHLEGEGVAEQEREDHVELGENQGADGEPDRVVHRRQGADDGVGGIGQVADVGDQDAEEREGADGVDLTDSGHGDKLLSIRDIC